MDLEVKMSLLERFKLEDQEMERMSLNKIKFPKKELSVSEGPVVEEEVNLVEKSKLKSNKLK